MSENLVESLRETTAKGIERNKAKRQEKAKQTISNREKRAQERKNQIRQFVKTEFPTALEEIMEDAKDQAENGETSVQKTWRRGWDVDHKKPEDDLYLEQAAKLRDKVARHFTKLEFQVTPIDEFKRRDVEKRPEDEGYWPAHEMKIVGVEISWAEKTEQT